MTDYCLSGTCSATTDNSPDDAALIRGTTLCATHYQQHIEQKYYWRVISILDAITTYIATDDTLYHLPPATVRLGEAAEQAARVLRDALAEGGAS